jgi:hypothetical protein
VLAAPAHCRVSQDSQQAHPAFGAQPAAGSTAVENGSFQPFLLEELQSRFEHDVECNLADSGVKAVTVEELVSTPEALQASNGNCIDRDTTLSFPQPSEDSCSD